MQTEGKSEPVVFTISLGSFDFHGDWIERGNTLMSVLANTLRVFLDDCTEMEILDQVVITTETDFGRKTFTNGAGTDHGLGFNNLTIGGRVQGGSNAVYGDMITAAHLADNDSWPVQFDARSILAEIIESHLGLNPATTAFPGAIANEFSRVSFGLFNA